MRRLHLRHAAAAPQRSSEPGAPGLRIRVNGGYAPDAVTAPLGRPIRITFHREDPSPCSERVVFTDLGIDTFLPLHEDVTVEIRPDRAGEFPFTCAMGMLRGRLTVTT